MHSFSRLIHALALLGASVASAQAVSPHHPMTDSEKIADAPMAMLQARRSAEGIRSVFSPNATWINPARSREEANSKPVQLLADSRQAFLDLQAAEPGIHQNPRMVRGDKGAIT